MTREEMNLRISSLRDEWQENGPVFKIPVDWHKDSNWPTLLRELPGTTILVKEKCAENEGGYCWSIGEEREYPATHSEDPGAAVCISWLRWKRVRI